MEYVVGSVAALVTGNVTPSRPRALKRALTPTKHQQSPNVTPKSEFIDDRSIFLSPSMQKKKAIIKKSPKRIFQNPDLETTEDGDGNLNLLSPKADKVKKHLKNELGIDVSCDTSLKCSPSSKNKIVNNKDLNESANIAFDQHSNENTPKKKKRKSISVTELVQSPSTQIPESADVENGTSVGKSPKKKKNIQKLLDNSDYNKENSVDIENQTKSSHNGDNITEQKKLTKPQSVEISKQGTRDNPNKKKKNKKRKKKPKQQSNEESTDNIDENTIVKSNDDNRNNIKKKKNKKRKKSKSQQIKPVTTEASPDSDEECMVKPKKSKHIVNPNAVTNKDTDSEHESDDEIQSENEEINKEVFASEPAASESSEEEDQEETNKQKEEKTGGKEKQEINVDEEIKRTLFVGNVPFSSKCKKEIKKIFNKHGQIDTIRIRTVPVKDGRYTPKLAVIKNELHPDRATVNVYIKYADEASVDKALVENNTVLNEHHLRVSRSVQTGKEHDPKCSIFLGNLPFAMEDEALRQKFESCGEIESVRIIRDKKTNAGKGFGYVNFASKDGVELALALTEEDLTIKNRIIRVKRCTQATNKQKQSTPINQRQNSTNQRAQNDRRQGSTNQRGPNDRKQGSTNQGVNSHRQSGNPKGKGQKYGPKDDLGRDGAHRRIMKRKSQEVTSEEPANKKAKNINQPNREKKTKKEFVGLTAEKKKKRKFDKGQKKKKALSEILTK